jgi:DNA excision repair protein ERCC-2
MGLFPYHAPRCGQAEFLEDARRAMANGRVLLAQAPTGLGKTAVALTSSLECGLETGKRVLFTTCRRSQHRIAVETLQRMREAAQVSVVDIIAREAMCPDCTRCPRRRARVEAVSRTILREVLHVQHVVQLAERYGVCPYRVAMRAARRADVVVCDYNYLFGPQRERALQSMGLSLEDVIVVVDEAHNLPSRSREALSGCLTAEGLEEMASYHSRSRAARALLSVARGLREASRVIGGDSRLPVSFLDRLILSCAGDGSAHPSENLASLLRSVREDLPPAARPALDESLRVLIGWGQRGHLRLLSRRGGGCISLVALDPRPATQEVFQRAHAALLMSGTLHPGEMYVDLLGIPEDRSMVRSYSPEFPPENRLLLVSSRLSSAYKERRESYEGYAKTIADLCIAVPENLAAFFPSYDMARRVGRILMDLHPPKTLLWERKGQSKAEKEDILKALENGRRGGGCLMMAVQGGSLSEGIDYRGNLLQAVIVAGLALSPPQLEIEALRSFYSRRFGRRKGYEYAYLYPALNRLVQCAGRCIRSPEDVAVVVILDSRLLRRFYRSRLPDGFQPTPCVDPAERVRSFFYERHLLATSADQAGSRGRPEVDGVDGQEGGGEGPVVEGVSPP